MINVASMYGIVASRGPMASSYMTVQTLVIDAGWTAVWPGKPAAVRT